MFWKYFKLVIGVMLVGLGEEGVVGRVWSLSSDVEYVDSRSFSWLENYIIGRDVVVVEEGD